MFPGIEDFYESFTLRSGLVVCVKIRHRRSRWAKDFFVLGGLIKGYPMKALFTAIFTFVCVLGLLAHPVYSGVELKPQKIEMFFTLVNTKDKRVLTEQGKAYIRDQIVSERYDFQTINTEYKNWEKAVESKIRVVIEYGRKRFIVAEGLMDGRSYLFAPAADNEIHINQIKFRSLKLSDFIHVDKNHRINLK